MILRIPLSGAWTIAACATLVACESPTTPREAPSPVGLYALVSWQGKPLPAPDGNFRDFTYWTTGGSIELKADGEYRESFDFYTQPPPAYGWPNRYYTGSVFGHAEGQYIVRGATVVMLVADSVVAEVEWRGDTLVFSHNRYVRSPADPAD